MWPHDCDHFVSHLWHKYQCSTFTTSFLMLLYAEHTLRSLEMMSNTDWKLLILVNLNYNMVFKNLISYYGTIQFDSCIALHSILRVFVEPSYSIVLWPFRHHQIDCKNILSYVPSCSSTASTWYKWAVGIHAILPGLPPWQWRWATNFRQPVGLANLISQLQPQ